MYRDISQDLLEVIEPIADAHGLEIVDAAVTHGAQGRVYLVVDTPDGDGRVTIGACAGVSREIGHALEATGVLGASCSLEVSSPGVDRVLGREKDFERVLGHRIALETRTPLDGRRHFRGELRAFTGGEVLVETDTGAFRIPFDVVARAQAFSPLGSSANGRGGKR